MNKKAEFLLQHNREQSALFNTPDAIGKRIMHFNKHPTRIAVAKCMDGRVNLPLITGMEPGILMPFRNIGGIFEVGWPYLGGVLESWITHATRESRRGTIFLGTYHYSKGDHHRGCAGHKYDTAAAERNAVNLCFGEDGVKSIFGRAMTYPIVVGIETDYDTLVLHGSEGQKLDLSTMVDASEEEVWHATRALYPDMDEEMFSDLMPLVRGNISHIRDIKKMNRPIEQINHQESVIFVGRGFDWYHRINEGLIVGPYSPDIAGPIGVAGKVVLGNVKENRIKPDEGLVLMSAALYRKEASFERVRAAAKARSLARTAYAAIKATTPELIPHLDVLVGTVKEDTRLFTPVDFDLAA